MLRFARRNRGALSEASVVPPYNRRIRAKSFSSALSIERRKSLLRKDVGRYGGFFRNCQLAFTLQRHYHVTLQSFTRRSVRGRAVVIFIIPAMLRWYSAWAVWQDLWPTKEKHFV
jgi:hypothetical protein